MRVTRKPSETFGLATILLRCICIHFGPAPRALPHGQVRTQRLLRPVYDLLIAPNGNWRRSHADKDSGVFVFALDVPRVSVEFVDPDERSCEVLDWWSSSKKKPYRVVVVKLFEMGT